MADVIDIASPFQETGRSGAREKLVEARSPVAISKRWAIFCVGNSPLECLGNSIPGSIQAFAQIWEKKADKVVLIFIQKVFAQPLPHFLAYDS
jgi:hypothetical protein